ncbi:MAG: hypothetical protein CVT92_04745 [Bacteroidetes bacterium HGW-Bacteroidetes-1]|jgi:NADPH:quinone reductase-like Zn-dependent oxidoreductase|nr:MAG: hypothetical protein CVT92_04745 [Bacteroidetes bacterium HGW-Bacteroidetes-1]
MFPIHYKAVELPAYNANTLRALLGLHVVNKSVDAPKAGQLLLHMLAAPCNPSDIAFMQGNYNVVKSLPAVPGFEGAGIVIAAGEGVDGKFWIGKRVSCFAQDDQDGTWAEYFIAKPQQLIIVDERLTTEQAACFFINPFTAWGLFDEVLKKKSKAILINAGGSRVAEFFFALAKRNQIQCIATVRKNETALSLKQNEVGEVLFSGMDDFDGQLQKSIRAMGVSLVFDAVAGDMTGLIANSLPSGAEIIVYGGLSGKGLSGINPLQLIFKDLTIRGFNLNQWFSERSDKQINEVSASLAAMIITGEVANPIGIQVGITEIAQGLKHYLGSMSKGKMLIKF